MADRIDKTDAEWKAQRSADEYEVLREKGTERAFTGQYWDEKGSGMYRCKGCGEPVFSSETKYDSGTGWPSFSEPFGGDAVATETDGSLLMKRTEVHCAKCGGHLGHVFPDGPGPSGLRYCINSCSLDLDESVEAAPVAEAEPAEDGSD